MTRTLTDQQQQQKQNGTSKELNNMSTSTSGLLDYAAESGNYHAAAAARFQQHQRAYMANMIEPPSSATMRHNINSINAINGYNNNNNFNTNNNNNNNNNGLYFYNAVVNANANGYNHFNEFHHHHLNGNNNNMNGMNSNGRLYKTLSDTDSSRHPHSNGKRQFNFIPPFDC